MYLGHYHCETPEQAAERDAAAKRIATLQASKWQRPPGCRPGAVDRRGRPVLWRARDVLRRHALQEEIDGINRRHLWLWCNGRKAGG